MFSNLSLRSKLLTLVALPSIALMLFGAIAFRGAQATSSDLTRLQGKEFALSQASNEIRYLDEVLTASATRFISSEGDQRWWTRYESGVTDLDKALATARTNATAADLKALDDVDGANQKLIALETTIHDLVVEKKYSEANSLLQGEYDVQKDVYSAGVQKFFTSSQGRIGDVIAQQTKRAEYTKRLLALLAMVSLAIFAAAIAMARAIGGPIARLTEIAQSATVSLPTVLAKVQAGEKYELVHFAGKKDDEISALGRSFDQFQNSAVALATEQATLRVSVTEMLVNIGRRNQALVNKTLKFIGDLEQNERDEDRLQNLFQLDHMATRVRRNAESLLVLAGADSARISTRPVSISDVVNAAIAEVEDYSRVQVDRVDVAYISGTAAADVAHLLSEIIENAAGFSSPDTDVKVTSRVRGSEVHIFVADEGIGFDTEHLAAMNARLNSTDTSEIYTSTSLGLVVVARLARRHGIKVQLSEQITGTAAKIILPGSLLQNNVQKVKKTQMNARRSAPAQLVEAAAADANFELDQAPVQAVEESEPLELVAATAIPSDQPVSSDQPAHQTRPARRQKGANLFESGRNNKTPRTPTSAAEVAQKFGNFQTSVRSASQDLASGSAPSMNASMNPPLDPTDPHTNQSED